MQQAQDLDWAPLVPSHAVTGSRAVPCVAGGRELVAWRTASGEVQVWEDRCLHRGVRLSIGYPGPQSLTCGYHGWEYAAGSGRCIRIPAHPELQPPATIRARGVAAAEAHGMLWCSPGEAAQPPAGAAEGRFLRSMALRTNAATVRARLRHRAFTEQRGAWTGRLEAHALRVFLLDARPGLCFLHCWALADRQDLAPIFSALFLWRGELERDARETA